MGRCCLSSLGVFNFLRIPGFDGADQGPSDHISALRVSASCFHLWSGTLVPVDPMVGGGVVRRPAASEHRPWWGPSAPRRIMLVGPSTVAFIASQSKAVAWVHACCASLVRFRE